MFFLSRKDRESFAAGCHCPLCHPVVLFIYSSTQNFIRCLLDMTKKNHIVLHKFLCFVLTDNLKMPHKNSLANTHISLLQTMKNLYKTFYDLGQNSPPRHHRLCRTQLKLFFQGLSDHSPHTHCPLALAQVSSCRSISGITICL